MMLTAASTAMMASATRVITVIGDPEQAAAPGDRQSRHRPQCQDRAEPTLSGSWYFAARFAVTIWVRSPNSAARITTKLVPATRVNVGAVPSVMARCSSSPPCRPRKSKKRGKSRDSFRLTGSLGCGRGTVTLHRLGTLKTHEPTRKLARRLAGGTARILSATVSRAAQRWYVCFTVEVDRDVPDRHRRPGTAVGIDLGVKALITGADNAGNVLAVPGPRPLAAGLRRLRRASRAHSGKQPGSAGRRQSAARLARLHARIASIRADALHQATSMLAARYETVVAEDLNVAGMTRNRRLARAISDQGFGAARRMLAYKTTWNGGTLIVAGRWFSSSKKCSGCGHAKARLALSERTYRCDECGLVLDRDVNAARNLLDLAASGAESQNARGETRRPGPAGRVSVNLEPGTRHPAPGTRQRDKTGTASGQPQAAA
jgi:putative transposase